MECKLSRELGLVVFASKPQHLKGKRPDLHSELQVSWANSETQPHTKNPKARHLERKQIKWDLTVADSSPKSL